MVVSRTPLCLTEVSSLIVSVEGDVEDISVSPSSSDLTSLLVFISLPKTETDIDGGNLFMGVVIGPPMCKPLTTLPRVRVDSLDSVRVSICYKRLNVDD